ncbi:MAG: hypothetical protein Q3972_04825 [Corynebacterium sp.]|nr:hypothetical protein [Corynebacterium sp.]
MKPRFIASLALMVSLACLTQFTPVANAEPSSPASYSTTLDDLPIVADDDTSTIDDTAQIDPLMAEYIGRTPVMEYYPGASSEFEVPIEDDAVASTWQYYGPRKAWGTSGGWWLPSQAAQRDGVYRNAVLRYCLPEGEVSTQSFEGAVPTEDVCPEGTQTAYGTTRFEGSWIPNRNFRVVIRAYFGNDREAPGIRRNLWFQSISKRSDPFYAEFDLVEHFSSRQNVQHTNTHFSDMSMGFNKYYDDSILNGWHTWTVEVIDGVVGYYLDGVMVRDQLIDIGYVAGKRKDWAARYPSRFDQPFKFIFDTMIETEDSSWLKQPDSTQPWGKQWVDIAYIRTYVEPGTEFDTDEDGKIQPIYPREKYMPEATDLYRVFGQDKIEAEMNKPPVGSGGSSGVAPEGGQGDGQGGAQGSSQGSSQVAPPVGSSEVPAPGGSSSSGSSGSSNPVGSSEPAIPGGSSSSGSSKPVGSSEASTPTDTKSENPEAADSEQATKPRFRWHLLLLSILGISGIAAIVAFLLLSQENQTPFLLPDNPFDDNWRNLT